MYRVTYDYRAKDGFLTNETVLYQELQRAFILIRALASRKDVIGKPILERV
jgi:hypothetical protein